MKVLGVETSCDETALAVVDQEHGLLAHEIFSQVEIHSLWGGVVPELASRDHSLRILPLIKKCLKNSQISLDEINAFAFTAGPGLAGSLMVGATMTATLGKLLNRPVFPIHHLEGHIVAALIDQVEDTFPCLILLVSGGHTMIIQANEIGNYQIIGESLDDAVGEAFDKTAKLLGMPYPGGPQIEKFATKGDKDRFKLPRPMCNRDHLDMSFSGLKTAVVHVWQQSKKNDQDRADLAASFQQAVLDILIFKVKKAMEQTGYKDLVLCGGVAANLRLRDEITKHCHLHSGRVYLPKPEYCTDNGVMIAYAGMIHAMQQLKSLETNNILIKPRWALPDYLNDWWVK